MFSSDFAVYLRPSLRDLLLMQSRGKMRRAFKRLRSPRRAIPTLIVGVLLLLHLIQVYIAVSLNTTAMSIPVATVAPLGMLSILLLKLLGVCIDRNKAGAGFRSEETHQLLGGPFPRSQVRLFRVTGHAISIFFTSVFAAIFFRFHVSSFAAALCGSYLAMVFTYLVYTTIAVAALNATETTYTRVRNACCLGVIVLVASGLYAAAREGRTNLEYVFAFGKQIVWFSETWAGRGLLAPFLVFTKIIMADKISSWMSWTAIGLLLNYAALQLLLRSECFLVSRALRRELNDFRRQDFSRTAEDVNRCFAEGIKRCGMALPWWGGSGPIFWRQWKALTRCRGGLGYLILPIACAFAFAAYVAYDPAEGAFQTIALIVVLTSVFMPGLIPFDFRGDLRGLAALKMMPMKAGNVVMGQLMVPVLLLSAFQAIALSTLLLHDFGLLPTIILTMLCLLPVNLTILAIENLVFLLYPYRVADFDMQATVRRVIMLMTKFCVLFLAGVLSLLALLSVLALRLTTIGIPVLRQPVAAAQIPLMYALQFIALSLVAVAVFVATCWAYRRFDLTEDLPI